MTVFCHTIFILMYNSDCADCEQVQIVLPVYAAAGSSLMHYNSLIAENSHDTVDLSWTTFWLVLGGHRWKCPCMSSNPH